MSSPPPFGTDYIRHLRDQLFVAAFGQQLTFEDEDGVVFVANDPDTRSELALKQANAALKLLGYDSGELL
jgi:hypothetical protein